MTDFHTYELTNVDPDEISDVLGKVEKSYGFKFDERELISVKNFGELCDIIISKITGDSLNDCTTQQAFYKLRVAISETLQIDTKSIDPQTELHTLFPKNIRRQTVKAIDQQLGFKTKILRPRHAFTGLFVIIFLASLFYFYASWQVALLGMTFSSVGMKLAARLGAELEVKTVGNIAEKISREHYLKSRRSIGTVNRNELVRQIKELFIADLGLDKDQLTREAAFG